MRKLKDLNMKEFALLEEFDLIYILEEREQQEELEGRILEIKVCGETSMKEYYSYVSIGNDDIDFVDGFIEKMLKTYSALGFVNDLTLTIHGGLGGDSVIKYVGFDEKIERCDRE